MGIELVYRSTKGAPLSASDLDLNFQRIKLAIEDLTLGHNHDGIGSRLLSGIGDALVYRGALNCSTNPIYPAAAPGDTYKIETAGKIGGPAGPAVNAGDAIICSVATTAGDHAAVGAYWGIFHFVLDVDTDPDLAANSDATVPSQKAVKAYVAAHTAVAVGVPTGGTAGQVLAKVDGQSYNTDWIDPPASTPAGVKDIFTIPGLMLVVGGSIPPTQNPGLMTALAQFGLTINDVLWLETATAANGMFVIAGMTAESTVGEIVLSAVGGALLADVIAAATSIAEIRLKNESDLAVDPLAAFTEIVEIVLELMSGVLAPDQIAGDTAIGNLVLTQASGVFSVDQMASDSAEGNIVLSEVQQGGTSVSDNFNRADGGLGANWGAVGSDNMPTISGNTVIGNTYNEARWVANSFANNQFSQAKILTLYAGVSVRMSASQRTYYVALVDGDVDPGGLLLYKIVNGAPTALGSYSISDFGYLRLEVSGTSLTVKWHATDPNALATVITAQSSTITTGAAGIAIMGDAGALDDWSGGDL